MVAMDTENAAAAKENYKKNYRLEQQNERLGFEGEIFQIFVG